MVYFGLSLGTGDLAGNTYINVCFAGLVDIFANVGLFFCLDKIGRITLISTSLLLGGIFCALMAISGASVFLVYHATLDLLLDSGIQNNRTFADLLV